MNYDFKGKTALITGGSFGIGRAAAISFARNGANVVIADWVDEQEVLDTVRKEGGNAIFIKCDVSNEDQVKNLIQTVVDTFGRLDYAFNNAGVEGASAPTHECTRENWERVLGVNLLGTWLCMKYEIEAMLKNGSGAIVNNSSIAGLVGFPGVPAYVASKHGMIGLTKNAALEYAKQSIRVNAVCPGVIRTPMIDRFTGKSKEVEKAFESAEPIGRLGEPDEVAEAVLWLCSDKASFVTGHSMVIDGGWVAQ
jgi:NAD(P)-dependent dehydrogenase (short-subunit alcohol dehydrogenase family)